MSAQRIVVTSPWKLGLFVFLLVAGCGFGLIYAYYQYFGGTLDFTDRNALYTFYGVCGGVAFLGLLGYLAVVGAAQPVDRVVHGGRRRQRLMKKAAGIEDPSRVDLEDFQDEPTLAALLERWREDRSAADGARAELASIQASAEASASAGTTAPVASEELRRGVEALRQHHQSLSEVCDRMSSGLQRAVTSGDGLDQVAHRIRKLAEEAGGLALNANLHLSRMGEEAAPLLDDMEQLREVCTRFQSAAEQIDTAAGRSGGVGLGLADGVADLDEGLGGLDTALRALEASVGVEASEAAPQTEDPVRDQPAFAAEEAPSSGPQEPAADTSFSGALSQMMDEEPAAEDEPSERKLAQVHEELFAAAPKAAPSGPVDTRQEEKVYDLSEFGAVALDDADAAPASSGERIYDLSEFGAVEL